MRRFFLLLLFTSSMLLLARVMGQERNGSISGTVTDSTNSALSGARVELQPKGLSVATNGQGQFFISDLPPGRYTVTVSYVGFKPYSSDVTVASSQAARVDAVLEVGGQSEVVTVRGEREYGELEAINRERTADLASGLKAQQETLREQLLELRAAGAEQEETAPYLLNFVDQQRCNIDWKTHAAVLYRSAEHFLDIPKKVTSALGNGVN